MSSRRSKAKPIWSLWPWADGCLAALLLLGALAGAWLPVGWMRELTRTEQAPYYAGLTLGYCLLYAVLWPWLAAAYWRTGDRPGLRRFVAASLVGGLIVTLPLALLNAPALLAPYQFQGHRRLIGESVWFLVQTTFFDPTHATPHDPWLEPSMVVLDNTTLTAIQGSLTTLVFALSLWRLWGVRSGRETFERWGAAGLIGVAVFALTNRIFSPQYVLFLAWCWAAALVLRPVGWRGLVLGYGLIGVVAGANFQVFSLGDTPAGWFRASVLLFATAFVLSTWLLWRALAMSEGERRAAD